MNRYYPNIAKGERDDKAEAKFGGFDMAELPPIFYKYSER